MGLFSEGSVVRLSRAGIKTFNPLFVSGKAFA